MLNPIPIFYSSHPPNAMRSQAGKGPSNATPIYAAQMQSRKEDIYNSNPGVSKPLSEAYFQSGQVTLYAAIGLFE